MSTSSREPTQTEPAVVSTGWLAASMFDRPVERRFGRAFGVSLAVHGALLALLLLAGMKSAEVLSQAPELIRVVFLQQPPGPGGGGGGSPAPAPPKPVEIPKPKADPIPITPPPVIVPPPPMPTLQAPVFTNAQLLQASGQSNVSLQPLGGGGRGGGQGEGRGRGVGAGETEGFGGGAFRGGGITAIKSVDPTYTSEAMRQKIQGQVELEIVVLENGTVGDVRIIRSLDRNYGLDQKAVEAAKQWLFRAPRDPQGRPMRAIVTLLLDFRLF